MTKKIIFRDKTKSVPKIYYPTPASRHIPGWLKNLSPYNASNKIEVPSPGLTNQTAKRCIPMLDAIMTGYTIVTTEDFSVTQKDGNPYFMWGAGLGIEFHTVEQVGNHPAMEHNSFIPKWLNPWSIETPRGYSSLIIPPINDHANPMQIFSGLVDTDTYIAPVNLPFTLKNPTFEGIIPAGTPIAQVIPVKRESWKIEFAEDKDSKIAEVERIIRGLVTNAYRSMFWSRKDYR